MTGYALDRIGLVTAQVTTNAIVRRSRDSFVIFRVSVLIGFVSLLLLGTLPSGGDSF